MTDTRRTWRLCHAFSGGHRLWARHTHYYLADQSGDDSKGRKGTPDDTDDGPLRVVTATPIVLGARGAVVPVLVERDGSGGRVPMSVSHALVLSTMVPGLRFVSGDYEWSISLVDRTHLAPTRGETTACGLRERFRHKPTTTTDILHVTCEACVSAHERVLAFIEGQHDGDDEWA